MSDVIRLLPDSVANQIAAGEVIQRPSSVIKELVENSIDAGATQIQVIVVEAGKTSIQVIDNGKGMSGTDARLAFERHATSKIREASDLFSLRTMGFRGEALPSIVAVSQVELRTRMADEELGVSLVIEGSKVMGQEPIACPVGCNFIVKNLFFNIPARRKFLKSNQTELSNILTEFERIALANPGIAFTLHSGDNLLLNLPSGNFKQRILSVFGKKMDAQLISIKVETSLVKISGYIGSPRSAKKKGAHQFFFVNGRYMRHPYFNKAVQSAYDRLIPDGEQVSYFISFEVDPNHIDVNIHPAKTEIKFQDEQAIWPIILAAVRESLGKYAAVPTIDFDTANRPDIPTFQSDEDQVVNPPQVYINSEFNPFDASADADEENFASFSPAAATSYAQAPAFGGEKTYAQAPSFGGNIPLEGRPASRGKSSGRPKAAASSWQPAFEAAFGGGQETPPVVRQLEPEEIPNLYDNLPSDEQVTWKKDEMALVQFRGRFIVATAADGLLMIDQHRAHFRVLYDQYKTQMHEHRGISQGLLFPQLLQLPASSATFLEGIQDELSAVGFELSPLGGGSFSVLGIPAGTEGLDPLNMLQSLVDDAMHGEAQVKDQVDHQIALSLSRKAALPVGQQLDEKEMTDLLDKLFASSNANYTPDGATIMATITNDNIEKLFG